ncbi:uncharacterized protein [Chelonus insularis]|uniref:uncharacterized protein isoform X2 n=1 Tax=Chelonus insularis TaxID=460826 RepID=UPI00158BDA2A|nr:uncharacterized protein LOC118070893 isoform X2 [Chelonus insularis]
MENRPAPLRSRRVCRFCLTENEPLNFIYERDPSKPFQVPLTLQIMSCVAIEVYSADGMPQMICNYCRWNLDRSYKFKQQCKKADEALRAYPATGVLPRPFPPITNDSTNESGKRTLEQRGQDQIKKVRVDNGDRERRERERQDSSSIKSDRNDYYKEEMSHPDSEGDEETDDKDGRKLEPGEIRVHACDQCDRTFPLKQALQLHIQSAHRDRNFKCTECERMFFSKYDLQKHMSTHSEEKPYSCTICNKKFTRANLLQRHEKIHREDLRYSCQHCDREFFTREELEKHEDTSHKTTKPYQCNICSKRFTYKQGLERHEMLHAEDKTFTCEYCKEAFRTSTKLARHLQTHAGHRPYLCKLCPRDFLLSHHLTRHMRTHSVEKRHVCEECGKAFKRKESLEVHHLTHSKRTGMGLTCPVCQESCRNRADYVTHMKQHIEAGEKMGPDGLSPDSKDKLESESEEEEEEEQFSDGDDDYEPPASLARKYQKPIKRQPEESEEDPERAEKEERKEQVVFVRGKDGQIIKKTIKTLMPIQRRDVSETRTATKTSPTSSAVKVQHVKQEETSKNRVDDTEAEEQGKDMQTLRPRAAVKEEKIEPGTPVTAKSVNTSTKVIKRIVVKKPATGSTETSTTVSVKDTETVKANSTNAKVKKRIIVRRTIRQGDVTREIIMNPDGTEIDPSELAKLPKGNVVKRVVVKKPVEKNVVQVLQSSTEQHATVSETPKFELKTSQSTVNDKTAILEKAEIKTLSIGDQETKEKLEQLEKRVEQQRLKIEELQARKQQQEYEPIDDMLPERHDSEDEQELPLKRVFVKRKQSIYDEEREYNDTDIKTEIKVVEKSIEKKEPIKETTCSKTEATATPVTVAESTIVTPIIAVVTEEEPSEVEQMSRELSSILDTADNVAKIQENVLSNLSEISGIESNNQEEEKTKVESIEKQVEEPPAKVEEKKVVDDKSVKEKVKPKPIVKKTTDEEMKMEVDEVVQNETTPKEAVEPPVALEQPELNESTDIFEASDSPIQKSTQNLEDSVIALSQANDTINLNDTNDSQDSLEDKLSQMEG